MSFEILTDTRKQQTERKQIDWDALQNHVIEASKTQSKSRSIPGVISGIYSLGIQERPDFEEEFNGNEAEELAANPQVTFKTKGKKKYKCVPQKPVAQVAIAIDFPQVVVDKGQFFDNPNPLPLRLILNGETSLHFLTNRDEDKGKKVLMKGFSLSETKDKVTGKWGVDKRNTLYKLADAVGIVGEDGVFKAKDVDKLLGKVAQFEFRIYMKPGKEGKSYYREEIKLVGMVPEGVPLPEFDESILHMIQFTSDNSEEDLKQLRQSVINTMVRASNFAGSKLAEQLGDRVPNEPETPADEESEENDTPVAPEEKKASKKLPEASDDGFNPDDDLPF